MLQQLANFQSRHIVLHPQLVHPEAVAGTDMDSPACQAVDRHQSVPAAGHYRPTIFAAATAKCFLTFAETSEVLPTMKVVCTLCKQQNTPVVELLRVLQIETTFHVSRNCKVSTVISEQAVLELDCPERLTSFSCMDAAEKTAGNLPQNILQKWSMKGPWALKLLLERSQHEE